MSQRIDRDDWGRYFCTDRTSQHLEIGVSHSANRHKLVCSIMIKHSTETVRLLSHQATALLLKDILYLFLKGRTEPNYQIIQRNGFPERWTLRGHIKQNNPS
jgi:hypothetical protein